MKSRSFVAASISLLQCHFVNKTSVYYEDNFPCRFDFFFFIKIEDE